jgi:hypothetical protein
MFPLFSQTDGHSALTRLLDADVMVFLIPIVALLVGGILGIIKLVMRHKERMAMIERGMHPDSKDNEPPLEKN